MHSETPPIACTLNAQDMASRFEQIRSLTRQHLREHVHEGPTLTLRYDGTAAQEVERLVSLERACCAFLEFTVERAADMVELRIAAPEREGMDATWLFEHFMPRPPNAALQDACACCRR